MLPVISDPESLTAPGAGSSDQTSAAFDLLADHRRRAVLRHLDEFDSPVSLETLAEHVTLEEEGHESGAIADWGDALLGTHRRVRISLRHVHLPKLADADAIEFDYESNTVTLLEAGAELLAQLDSTEADAGAAPQSGEAPVTTPSP